MKSAVFVASFALLGLSDAHCGQREPPRSAFSKDLDYTEVHGVRDAIIQHKRRMRQARETDPSAEHGRALGGYSQEGELEINTVIHDIGGVLTTTQIEESMTELNVAFEGYFHFNLAQTLVHDDTWLATGCDTGEASMKASLAVDVANYYNVYFTDCASFGLYGFSTFPPSVDSSYGAEDDTYHGTVLDHDTVPGGTMCSGGCEGDTLSHETGHFLGLFHSFQQQSSEDGNPCEDLFGDLVADTPAVNGPIYGDLSACPDGLDTCPDDPGEDDRTVMQYYEDVCLAGITEGQGARALWATITGRPTLISAGLDASTESCIPGYQFYSNLCNACPVGFYKDTVGPEGCTRCPAGYATTAVAATGAAVNQADCYDPFTGENRDLRRWARATFSDGAYVEYSVIDSASTTTIDNSAMGGVGVTIRATSCEQGGTEEFAEADTAALYGTNTIVGRGVVRADTDECANVVLSDEAGASVNVLFITLEFDDGTVILSQEDGNALAETVIQVSFDDAAEATAEWYLTTAGCDAAVSSYNPYLLADETSCSTSSDHSECTVGNLNGRHGSLTLPGSSIYVDTNVPLQGSQAISDQTWLIIGDRCEAIGEPQSTEDTSDDEDDYTELIYIALGVAVALVILSAVFFVWRQSRVQRKRAVQRDVNYRVQGVAMSTTTGAV